MSLKVLTCACWIRAVLCKTFSDHPQHQNIWRVRWHCGYTATFCWWTLCIRVYAALTHQPKHYCWLSTASHTLMATGLLIGIDLHQQEMRSAKPQKLLRNWPWNMAKSSRCWPDIQIPWIPVKSNVHGTCSNNSRSMEHLAHMPCSQGDSPRDPLSKPWWLRAVLGTRRGVAQYWAGNFNVVADWLIKATSEHLMQSLHLCS